MSGIDNLPRGFAYEEISIVGLFKEGNMASVDGYVMEALDYSSVRGNHAQQTA
jgi:hypothetical protein